MKSYIYRFLVVFVVITAISLLVSCSSNMNMELQDDNKEVLQKKKEEYIELTNATPSVKDLLKSYPHLVNDFKKVPLEDQGILVVPTLSEIPFAIKKVELAEIDFDYGYRSISVLFSGTDERLKISVWERSEILAIGEEVKLNNGIIGYFYNADNQMAIHWRDPKEGSTLLYGVGLGNIDFETFTVKPNEFTKEDVIKLSNSIIDKSMKNVIE